MMKSILIIVSLLFSLSLSSQIKLKSVKFGRSYDVDVATATIDNITGTVYLQKLNNNKCYGLFYEADIKKNRINKVKLNTLIRAIERMYDIKLTPSKAPVVRWTFKGEFKRISVNASNAGPTVIVSVTDYKIYNRGVEIK